MKKKYPLRRAKKNKFGAFDADPFPQNLKLEKDGFEKLWGVGGGLAVDWRWIGGGVAVDWR